MSQQQNRQRFKSAAVLLILALAAAGGYLAAWIAWSKTDEEKICSVVINEVMSSNSMYAPCPEGRYTDWVELYNMTAEDIDLDGMYLSDEPGNPTKYRISAEGTETSTIIPAHGHRIIWCDKQDTQEQLHAPFKLANEDGAVITLTAADESWADTLVYCAHDGMQTVGRFPDGVDKILLDNFSSLSRSSN